MCSKNCVNFLKSHGAWQAITDDPLYKSREIQNVKKFKTSQSIVWKWTCHQLWAFDTSWPGQGVETMLQAHDFVREGIQLEWWLSIFRAAYTLQRYFQFVCTSTLVCVKHACGKLVQAKEGGARFGFNIIENANKKQTKTTNCMHCRWICNFAWPVNERDSLPELKCIEKITVTNIDLSHLGYSIDLLGAYNLTCALQTLCSR